MRVRISARKRLGSFTLSIDCDIDGSRLGLFGDSGSGKSTLSSMLAGLTPPDSGEIHLDDRCLFDNSRRVHVPIEQRRVAIVRQQPALFPHLNVTANLLYGYHRCAPGNRAVTLDLLVSVLKLNGLLHRGVNNLSGGEKQRVALGRAILANPILLLLDEPLSGLDDMLKFQIIPYLIDVSERFHIPYLFISHSVLEMRLMAESVLVLDRGVVKEVTTPENLARERMGQSRIGYINLFKVSSPRRIDGLLAYRWGDGELLVSDFSERTEAVYELSSRDIILFKRHPEAISARNLFEGTVTDLFPTGSNVGIELACGCERLISEVSSQAAQELAIAKGNRLFAAIKASAFRRLS